MCMGQQGVVEVACTMQHGAWTAQGTGGHGIAAERKCMLDSAPLTRLPGVEREGLTVCPCPWSSHRGLADRQAPAPGQQDRLPRPPLCCTGATQTTPGPMPGSLPRTGAEERPEDMGEDRLSRSVCPSSGWSSRYCLVCDSSNKGSRLVLGI